MNHDIKIKGEDEDNGLIEFDGLNHQLTKSTKGIAAKALMLENSIPEPQRVIINGQLDEMKVSKSKLGLQTEQGFVNVFANNKGLIQRIVAYMGKEVTILGMAHYKPNGQLSFVEIQEFSKPNATDKFFSKKPDAMTASQQLLFQSKQKKKSSSFQALKSLSGLLKNDITDEQFAEMLNDTHR